MLSLKNEKRSLEKTIHTNYKEYKAAEELLIEHKRREIEQLNKKLLSEQSIMLSLRNGKKGLEERIRAMNQKYKASNNEIKRLKEE
eukprot:8030801-Ditylum_brightwellii.AAC.1